MLTPGESAQRYNGGILSLFDPYSTGVEARVAKTG
jgi:hypothetical protein